ncbi:hypothetical protein AL755_16240 [Arthrobacter sp. ERGS1:01]|uniref:alpha/beta hydrolase n=1 Tax=Arthrobacter sp. ERGS1:01 TaxID=1704044 RepID=UPI0006B66C19|nr:alpha/beta hydrolase-fold protein [Arthrobacter sp. ERGS1:01]ALE06650.1 hypothetical protein AL755_16240 [Arthrobacter sp. ERGS1:01]
MNNLAQLPIVNGPAPAIFFAAGILGLLWLAWGNRRHLILWMPIALLLAAAATLVFWYLAEKVWNLWGEPLPTSNYLYAGLGLFALLLAVPKIVSLRRWWARLLVLPVAAIVVVSGAGLINQSFEYYPTIGSLYGDTGTTIKTMGQFQAENPLSQVEEAVKAKPVTAADWVAPANMPAKGEVLKVAIPGKISHESVSSAYVYLPPAFLATPRPNLPVLVLIHGVPGGSIDWLRGGQINKFMDQYAADHHGLAPVVVMPDAGGKWAYFPPLCMNSAQGQSATYLTRDVPNWVKSTLGAGTSSPRQWAIGGFSYGGTCAMTLATNYPHVYPTFIDSSGESQPTIDQGQATLVEKYFDGHSAEFAKQDALDVLRNRSARIHSYTGVSGIVTVGANDKHYRPQGIEVYKAMHHAGMDVQLQFAPGGHAWPAWRYGVYQNMDWLMGRLGVN